MSTIGHMLHLLFSGIGFCFQSASALEWTVTVLTSSVFLAARLSTKGKSRFLTFIGTVGFAGLVVSCFAVTTMFPKMQVPAVDTALTAWLLLVVILTSISRSQSRPWPKRA